MSAKSELIERLKYIDSAASLPTLIDNGIAQSEHNSVANLLRKGICIVAFNILEDYIKKKAIESLDILALTGISYTNLSDFLQESAINGALTSLNFQARILKGDGQDYKLTIQEETRKIASTIGSPFELSKYTLLSSGSNVTSDEIGDFLRAFGITGGWRLLKTISDSVGGGIPDLAVAFRLASQRRHSCAHSANFNYDYTWLTNLKTEILSICSAIDIAISARCRQATRNPNLPLVSHDLNNELKFRFLELHGNIYKETTVIGGRSRKNWSDLSAAFASLMPQLNAKKEFLIVLNSQRRIMDWQT
jgi:hypothetical protein